MELGLHSVTVILLFTPPDI